MQSICQQLYNAFSSTPTDERCLFIDTFAVVCCMHKCGQKTAALKILPDLFNAVGRSQNQSYASLAANVAKVIDGNEDELAAAVPSRIEFKALQDSRKPTVS